MTWKIRQMQVFHYITVVFSRKNMWKLFQQVKSVKFAKTKDQNTKTVSFDEFLREVHSWVGKVYFLVTLTWMLSRAANASVAIPPFCLPVPRSDHCEQQPARQDKNRRRSAKYSQSQKSKTNTTFVIDHWISPTFPLLIEVRGRFKLNSHLSVNFVTQQFKGVKLFFWVHQKA